MLSDRCVPCPVCLSVTFVYCGQTVGCIKMKLGTEVGLGPGYIVLDGDPAPPKGAQPTIFGPCLLWPNGWMDQDAIWYGCGPWPMWHCVRCGPSPPHGKGHSSLQFSAHFALHGRPSQQLLNSCLPSHHVQLR